MLFRQVSAGFCARCSYAVQPVDTYRFPVVRGTAAGQVRDAQPRNSSRSWGGGSTPICSRTATSAGETSVSGQPGQGERRESATDVRLDGDEMAADADDGDVASRARPGEDRQHGGKEAIAEAFAELERAQQAVIMAKGALHMAKDAV